MPLQNIEDWDPILKANAASMLIIEGPAEAGAKLTYDVDLGPKPLDRERMKQQARAGENWYMSVLKLVFSYVNGGLSDQQIHEQTEPLTLTGYTSQQTAADVQKMIKSARKKLSAEHTPKEVQKVETEFLNKFHILDASELTAMEFAPLTFLCEKLLPSVGLAMLAGPPKAGKSWQALTMAQEMINQGHEVFYIAAEDNHRRLKDRILQVFMMPPKLLKFHAGLSQDHPIPRGQEALTYLREVHAAMQPSCIIIDTVASVLNPSGTSKNYDVTVSEYEALRKLASELKIAILVVHHTKKKSEVSQSPLEQVLGSTGITATVETIMVMENVVGSKDRKLHLTGKDVEQDEFYLRWNGKGYDFEEDAVVASLGPVQKEVLNFIQQNPRCPQKAIVVGLGKDQGQISKILDHLIEHDLAVKTGDRYAAR